MGIMVSFDLSQKHKHGGTNIDSHNKLEALQKIM
jgi:hypothetical protein